MRDNTWMCRLEPNGWNAGSDPGRNPPMLEAKVHMSSIISCYGKEITFSAARTDPSDKMKKMPKHCQTQAWAGSEGSQSASMHDRCNLKQ